jgi:hypothetical protein
MLISPSRQNQTPFASNRRNNQFFTASCRASACRASAVAHLPEPEARSGDFCPFGFSMQGWTHRIHPIVLRFSDYKRKKRVYIHTTASWPGREDRNAALVWLAMFWIFVGVGFGFDLHNYLQSSRPYPRSSTYMPSPPRFGCSPPPRLCSWSKPATSVSIVISAGLRLATPLSSW